MMKLFSQIKKACKIASNFFKAVQNANLFYVFK